MQSKTFRGVRHLLVSAGVISLVLSVAAPAALADKPADAGSSEPDGDRIWVCHATASEANPFEINLVSRSAAGHDGEQIDLPELAEVKNKAELERLLAADPGGVLQDGIDAACIAAGVGDGAGGGQDGSDGVGGGAGGGQDGNAGVGGGAGGGHDGNDGVGGGAGGAGGGQDGSDGVGGGPGGGQDGNDDTGGDGVGGGDTPDPVVAVVETPAGNGSGSGQPDGTPPVTPADPIPPAGEPREVLTSSYAMTRPVTPAATPASPAATPASPAATPQADEVLGAVTTRIPSAPQAASVLGAQTVRTPTALAATGSGTTYVLASVGLVLLVAGFGLQVGARRRMRSTDLAV